MGGASKEDFTVSIMPLRQAKADSAGCMRCAGVFAKHDRCHSGGTARMAPALMCC